VFPSPRRVNRNPPDSISPLRILLMIPFSSLPSPLSTRQPWMHKVDPCFSMLTGLSLSFQWTPKGTTNAIILPFISLPVSGLLSLSRPSLFFDDILQNSARSSPAPYPIVPPATSPFRPHALSLVLPTPSWFRNPFLPLFLLCFRSYETHSTASLLHLSP